MPGRQSAAGPFRFLPKLLVAGALLAALALLPPTSLADDGYATWYGQPFHGRTMANGQVFDMNDPTTTASNMFPFGTWLKVTNPANGRSVVVQVRDRGGFTHALDLSYAAFALLDDPRKMGIAVRYEVVPGPNTPAPQPTPVPAPTPMATPVPAPKPAAPPTEYAVAAGDTLFAIARRFGLNQDALATWNGLADPDKLLVGQRLALRAPASGQHPAPSARSDAPSQSSPQAGVYLVVEGDTLWAIAVKNGTTPERIAELNGLSGDLIVVGQALRLPAFSAPAAAEAANHHVVREGDTLFDIALHNGTTVTSLVRINGLDESDLLQIGQVILLR